MQYAVSEIKLNQSTQIPVPYFNGFHIYNYIDQGLPYGYFKLSDFNGNYFSYFENLQIGAKVDIQLTSVIDEQSKNPETRKFPTYYILYIENDCKTNVGKFAGNITIWFGHAWFLFKDVKNHIYAPDKIDKMIKKIVESKDRGMGFNVKNLIYYESTKTSTGIRRDVKNKSISDNWDKTDDDGKLPRFKICESDWDFIHDKLMPYASIGKQPIHFFCDDMSDLFYLKSFKNLYKRDPKIVFRPDDSIISDDRNAKRLKKVMDKWNIADDAHYIIGNASINICNVDILKEIYPSFYLENLQYGTFTSGTKQIKNQLGPAINAQFKNLLPIDSVMITSTKGTSVKLFHNRPLMDSLSLLFNSSKFADEMFKVNVTSYFVGNKVVIGDTAEMFTAEIDQPSMESNLPSLDDKRPLAHWISGKWLVSGIEHFSSEQDPKVILSTCQLIRSAFVGNEESISLLSPGSMFNS